MLMRNFKTEAIVLSYRNFSEADRFLDIFTKEHGKLSVLAKGVRRVPSRRAPHLEPFTCSSIFLHETSSGNLIVSQAETVEAFENLRTDIRKIGLAFYAVELVSKLTKDNQEHADVFDRLLLFLSNLNARDLPPSTSKVETSPPSRCGIASQGLDYEAIINDFQQDILKYLGFGPQKLAHEKELRYYIEELLEGRLKTPEFLDKISSR